MDTERHGLKTNQIERAPRPGPLPVWRGESGAERRVSGTIQFLFLSVCIRVHPWLIKFKWL